MKTLWKKLTAAEKARLLSALAVGSGMALLAMALGYFAYQVGVVRQEIPVLLAQIESTSEKVAPVLHEADAIRALVPPILKEVKATRETVTAVVGESAELRKTLPSLVETSAAAINNASSAVRAIEPHIPPVLAEVKNTREALPGILNHADQLVGRAEVMGREAGKGAVTGLVGGIIYAPFRLLGDVGTGLTEAIGLGNRREFTAEDDRLMQVATDAVLKNGAQDAQQRWQNPVSGNRGTVLLQSHKKLKDQSCVTLQYRVEFKTGKPHDTKLDLCQLPNGAWQKPKAK